MRAADYKCKGCGAVVERVFGSTPPATIHTSHNDPNRELLSLPPKPAPCRETEMHRVYSPVAIGAGTSGRTPARPR